MALFTESLVEAATLAWLSDLGYTVAHGELAAERGTSMSWNRVQAVILCVT